VVSVLSAAGVTRSFRPAGSGGLVEVLRGVDLELCDGELVTLAGPSGSGKSALLAILAGFDRPDSGTVTVPSRPPSKPSRRTSGRAPWPSGPAPRLGPAACAAAGGAAGRGGVPWSTLAIVPQSLGLVEELTLEENAATPLLFTRTRRLARPAVLARAAELLGALGVGELARRYPAEVSLGQQQRVALARALIVRPAVLLADEPTAHLDHRTIERVIEVLLAAVAAGTACLLATHDQALTTRAHRRLGLHHGKLVSL
jgi:putative ABC transport system ATP-binding protein